MPGKEINLLFLVGSMVMRSSMFILASGILLAGLTMHAGAGSVTTAVQQNPGMDSELVARRAYLGWLAEQQEAGMAATIQYLASINGSVVRLESLAQEFHTLSAGIPAGESGEGISASVQELRIITRQFREETRWILAASGGSSTKLAEAVSGTAGGGPGTPVPGDEFWMTLMADEPSSVGRYIGESQAMLSVLQEHGYDTAVAQERLDRIAALHSEYSAAVRSGDYGSATAIRGRIHDTSAGFEEAVRGIQPCDPVPGSGRAECPGGVPDG